MLRDRLERIDATAEHLARNRAIVTAALEQADAGKAWAARPTSSTAGDRGARTPPT